MLHERPMGQGAVVRSPSTAEDELAIRLAIKWVNPKRRSRTAWIEDPVHALDGAACTGWTTRMALRKYLQQTTSCQLGGRLLQRFVQGSLQPLDRFPGRSVNTH